MQRKQHTSALNWKIAHFAIIAVGAAIFIGSSFFDNIWFDESYSVGAVSNGMIRMMRYISYDVHPHLYYFLLKLYSYVCGNGIIALRIFSALFAVGISALGYTHIRKDFGEQVGFWFSFIFTFTFANLKYATQIRMYTLAIFLVTLTAVYAYRRMKEDSRKNRVLYLVFSVLSAYTHYFAFFTIAMINAFTLARAIKNRAQKGVIKNWLIDAVIQFGAYAPGIAVFLLQISLDGAAWINVYYPDILFDTAVYPFFARPLSEVVQYGTAAYYIVGCALTAMFTALYVRLVFLYRKDSEKYSAPFWGTTVCLAVLAFSLVVSIFRPIYYIRYSVCFYGILAFALAYGLSNLTNKAVKAVFSLLLAGIFVFAAIPFWQENYSDNNDNYAEQLPEVQEGDIFITDNAQVFACTVSFPNHKVIFYNHYYWSVDDAYKAFGEQVDVYRGLESFDDYTGRIWVSGNKVEEYITSFEGTELICEKQLHTDYYDYNMYVKLYEKTSNVKVSE